MNAKEEFFTSSDNETGIRCKVFVPEGQAYAILQICHGMAEHIDRYDDFARYLASKGVVVCALDHKGHGKSKGEAYGYFGKGSALGLLVEDQLKLVEMMRKTYKHLPYVLLGHSMGSFVARRFISEHHGVVDGAIICGTAGPGMPVGAGIFLSKLVGLFTPAKKQRPFLGKVAFAGYNKKTGSDTPNSWLTRDEEIVKKYNDDPLCGFAFTPSAYAQMFECIKLVNSSDWAKSVEKSLPLLVTAGKEDPVGNYGDGPTKVYDMLKDEEVSDVQLRLYENDRHEILNELDRDQVYADFLEFIVHVAQGVNALLKTE